VNKQAILALTLKQKHPLWSHDHDFQNIKEIVVVTIHDLIAMMQK
jgi:hypothetical protein